MLYKYPLELNFKIFAWGPQIRVFDADGRLILYVKQKALKLKEEVTVFVDEAQTQPLFTINADRVLDFSARYSLAEVTGAPLGAVKREGMRSLWRAEYNIYPVGSDVPALKVKEESVMTRFLDGCINQIPILGLFSGYFLHPAYLVQRADESVIMRLQKLPAFLEGKFKIETMTDMPPEEEKRNLTSLLMIVLLERIRG